MINVLLVDDQKLVSTGIEALLKTAENINVVGIADSGEKAIEAIQELWPDVVLMDVLMPGIGGIEACRRIIKRYPNIKVIALSGKNDGPIPNQLLKLGAQGFITKNSPVEEMVSAIQQVVNGKRYLCSEVAKNMAFSNLQGSDKSPFEKLSQREAEVVALILQGKTIQEMSKMLVISDKTINTYRYRIYEKLNLKNDVELTRLAVRFNYIDMTLI